VIADLCASAGWSAATHTVGCIAEAAIITTTVNMEKPTQDRNEIDDINISPANPLEARRRAAILKRVPPRVNRETTCVLPVTT
jgi:hypothetical protein